MVAAHERTAAIEFGSIGQAEHMRINLLATNTHTHILVHMYK